MGQDAGTKFLITKFLTHKVPNNKISNHKIPNHKKFLIVNNRQYRENIICDEGGRLSIRTGLFLLLSNDEFSEL
jgi:hypothetical protein